MSKRKYMQALFMSAVNDAVTGKVKVTDFRRHVVTEAMQQYSLSLASSATHYNRALHEYLTTHPEHREILVREEYSGYGDLECKQLLERFYVL